MALKEAIELLKKGHAYAKRTKYKEALGYYNRALSLDPRCAEGLFLRASIYIDTGKYKEALTQYKRILDLSTGPFAAAGKVGVFGTADDLQEYMKKIEKKVP